MPRVDAFFKKWLSRKLIVFITGTVALFTGFLSGTEWVALSSTYITVQGFVDGMGKK